MQYKHSILGIVVSALLFVGPLHAQVKLPPTFDALLAQAGLDFIHPLEAKYKSAHTFVNDLQVANFTMRSRKEKLEIRYVIAPYRENDPTHQVPHVAATRLALHLATNDQEAHLASHNIAKEVLTEQFQADWGKIFIFQPKFAFSSRNQCKMLALFREGRGMAYVFFLFDKPPETLDDRTLALRFN